MVIIGIDLETSNAQEGNVRIQQIATYPSCGGRGSILDKPCPECKGRGEVEREEALTVKVRAGVEEGMALRIPGHGHVPRRHPARGGAATVWQGIAGVRRRQARQPLRRGAGARSEAVDRC